MQKIRVLLLVVGMFLLLPTAWAETLLVTGTTQDNYMIYDRFGRDYKGMGTVNKEVQLAPASYQLTYHGSVQNITIQAGQKTVITLGFLTVSGTGQDRVYIYDELAKSNLASTYTNKPIELFPGTYIAQLNYFNSAPVAVVGGQTTTLVAGLLTVTGVGRDSYTVYDAFGKTSQLYSSASQLTGKDVELFAGTYSPVLNGTKQITTVQAGQKTILISGSYTVFGAGLDRTDIYDVDNTLALNLSHITNREVEIFPGTYTLRLNGTTQKVTIAAAQQSYLYSGVLKMPNLGSTGSYQYVFNMLGTQLFAKLPDTFTEVFPGTYKVSLNTLSNTVTVQAGDNIPADLAKTFPSAGTTSVPQTSTPPTNTTATTTPTTTTTPNTTVTPSYNDGISAGIAKCKTDPTVCGIVVNQNTDGSTQAGIDKCKADPASCGIVMTQNTDGSTQAGIEQCKASPSSCGIVTNNNIDGSTQIGIDQCKANPASCGIIVSANTDGSTQAGIAQCKADPKSCGIIINQNTDGSTQTGIDKCKADPASCGILYSQNTDGSTQAGIDQCKADPAGCGIVIENLHASYNPTSGELHLPVVDVGTEKYEVYLQQKPQGFLFDLDLARIIRRTK
jgi:hypothetical protein